MTNFPDITGPSYGGRRHINYDDRHNSPDDKPMKLHELINLRREVRQELQTKLNRNRKASRVYGKR